MPLDATGNPTLGTTETPYTGAVPLTGTPTFAGGRGVFIACTVAGNVALRFVNSSVLIVPVAVGPTILDNFNVVAIVPGQTTATAVVSLLL